MNYQRHYDLLIDRARGRKLDCYTERHHIIPRCMGGDNSRGNIVRLTAEEHYVSHQLLVKIYPHKKGLALAAHYMSKQCTGRRGYGWLRRKMAADAKGRVFSADTLKKMLERVRSPEARALASLKQTGKTYSEESRLKMALAKLGKKQDRAVVMARAERMRGHTVSSETKMKIALKAMGNKRALGIKHTPETIKNMSEAAIRRGISPENRKKMQAGMALKRAYANIAE